MLALYKFLKFLFRHVIPQRLHYPLARMIGRGVCRFNAQRRGVIVGNLTPLVGPEEAAIMAPALMGNFLMTAIDFFCPRPGLVSGMEIENWELLEETYRQHQRVMIVTAHVGNWELGISYLVRQRYPMTGVYATYTEDAIVRWILSHRNPNVEWIPTTPGAADRCVAAVERGRIPCIVADIPFGETGRRVEIAGHVARLPLGPWLIAARARAAVLPGFVIRTAPGHYKGTLHTPIIPGEGSLRRQMAQMQSAYAGYLETYLKRYPEQWGNLTPFWEKKF